MTYSKELKEATLKKMLPPNNMTLKEISKQTGITEWTLCNWRKKARAEGRLMPAGDAMPEGWSSRDKFAAVLETAAMNEADLSAYCRGRGRGRGLYPEQIKELDKELRRKEKALAEAAVILILRKKAQAIWG